MLYGVLVRKLSFFRVRGKVKDTERGTGSIPVEATKTFQYNKSKIYQWQKPPLAFTIPFTERKVCMRL